MIATFSNHSVGYHIIMLKCRFKQTIFRAQMFVYATGLNNRDNNVHDEM